MSSLSPTQPRRVLRARRLALGLAMLSALAASIGPLGRGMVYLAAHAHPHSPRLSLLAELSPAIRVHLAAALAALALGAALMLMRKGRRFHRLAGWTWVGLVSVVAGSSLFITSLTPGRWSLLHLLTGWTMIALPLGAIWARRHDVARHRMQMMGLFYGGFAINIFLTFLPGRVMWRLFFG